MKTTIFTILAIVCWAGISAAAQSKARQLDRLVKDPKTAENAAKADVYIDHRQKVILDTTQKAVSPAATPKRQKKKANPPTGK